MLRQHRVHLHRAGGAGRDRHRSGHLRSRVPARRHQPTTATAVGDVGESAPANWIGGLARRRARAHRAQPLGARGPSRAGEGDARGCARLRRLSDGAVGARRARRCPDNLVHFGYRDNIAQPTVTARRRASDDCPTTSRRWPRESSCSAIRTQYGARIRVQPAAALDQQQLRRVPHPRAGRRGLRGIPHEFAREGGHRSGDAGRQGVRPLAQRQPARARARRAGARRLPMEQLNDFTYVSTTTAEGRHARACAARSARTSGATTRATRRWSAPTRSPPHRAARHAVRAGLRSGASRCRCRAG